MLTRKRFSRLVLTATLLSLTLTIGFNCARFEATSPLSMSSYGYGDGETPPVGFLTSEQMMKAMISATGTEGLGEVTTPADRLIADTYDQRSGSLPSLQDLGQATAPTLISAANLAASICAKAVDKDAAVAENLRDDRLFFREIDFSQGLAGQTSQSLTAPFERLARNSWRREPSSEELQQIMDFGSDFAKGVSTTDKEQTRFLAISVCTAVLASIDSLTY